MKVITRYIAKEFHKLLIFAIASFTIIILSTDIFESLRMLIEHKVNYLIALEYFLYKTPYIIIQVMPVSVLLSTIFLLSILSKHNELTAMKVGGMNTYQIVAPILVSAFIISIVAILLGETVIPFSNTKAKEIKQVEILKSQTYFIGTRDNLAYINSSNWFFYIKRFDGEAGRMNNVSIYTFNKNNDLIERIDAKEAIYNENNWIFKEVYVRNFTYVTQNDPKGHPESALADEGSKNEITVTTTANELSENVTYLKETTFPIYEKPEDFCTISKKPEELTMIQLLERIKKLKGSGKTFKEELANLFLKTSFPFANFILVLLGIPLALWTGSRGGLILSFALSIAIGFAYWGSIAIGLALGKSTMNPLLSTWMGNIVFGALGLILLFFVRK
ncbi:MAG: LptF/LptG family permease [Candidatus Firestonebacteria bacterium]